MVSQSQSPGTALRWALLDNVDAVGTDEHVEELIAGRRWRLERIVSHGHTAPADPSSWYDQDEDEWVMVVSGSAHLTLLDPEEEIDLGPGDAVWLPAHRRHRVTRTAPDQATIWLALFVEPH